MTAPVWIVSSREPLCDNLPAWFTSLESRRQDVLPSSRFFLELTTQRAGYRGMMEDNPPLEKVDDLRMAVEDRGWSFGSISLPIRLDQADEEMGMEISNINGWIDLASYLGIPLARIQLLNPTLKHPQAQEAVSTLLRYLQESDLRIGISAEESLSTEWLIWLSGINSSSTISIGLDAAANVSTGEVPTLPAGCPLPVTTFRVPAEVLRSNPTEAVLTALAKEYPESTPAIVVEFPA